MSAPVNLILTTFSGDFNHDGTVDAADYLVWRDGLGSADTLEDYADRKVHFGLNRQRRGYCRP